MLEVTKIKNEYIYPAFYRSRGRSRVVLFIDEHIGFIVAGEGVGDLCADLTSCMNCGMWERVEVKIISDYTSAEVVQFPILCKGAGRRVVLFFDAKYGVELLPVNFQDVLKGKKNRFEVGACKAWVDTNNTATWRYVDATLS